MNQKVIFTTMVGDAIDDLVAQLGNPQVFVVVYVNTAQYVLPVLTEQSKAVQNAQVITVKAGDAQKTLENAQTIWRELHNNNATRTSVVINLV